MRTLRFLLFVIVILFLSSCLDVDTMNLYIYPDRENFNRGRIRIEFLHIHSTGDSHAKQKKEMEDFFASYGQNAKEIAGVFSIVNYKARLLHRKGLSTDGEITGEFRSLVAVLSGLLEESEYRIEGDATKFSFYRRNPGNETEDLNLTIEYPGKILSNNSKQFVSRTGVMKWSLNRSGDREISFSIESSPPENRQSNGRSAP